MLSKEERGFLRPDMNDIPHQAADMPETDPFELLREHRDDIKASHKMGKELSELLAEKKLTDKKKAEGLFLERQKIICHLARRFHPFSSYGKKILKYAADQRKAYEKKTGSMICAIDRNSSAAFSSVMSADIREAVEVRRYKAVGLLLQGDKGLCGVGSLAYYYDRGALDGERLLRVVWLYVHPGWRKRGCADMLLAEILHAALKNNVTAVTTDIETGEAWEELGTLLDKWFFRFTPGIDTAFAYRVADISDIVNLKVYKGKAKCLSKLSEIDGKHMIKHYFKGSVHEAYIMADDLPEDYIDTELSFYTGSLTKPGAMLLAHRKPSGEIEAEYAYTSAEAEDDIEILVGNFAAAAAIKYGKDTLLKMMIENEDDGDMLDDLFPKQLGRYIAEAILKEPDWDADEQDIKEALALIGGVGVLS